MDVRLGSRFMRGAKPIIFGFLVSTVGGALLGYYAGLKAAAEQVAALEELAKKSGERHSRAEIRLEQLEDSTATTQRDVDDLQAILRRLDRQAKESPLRVIPKEK